ncbi:hypothetical protein BDV97DRAFT_370117 [Delphinella strobiligena]|nr:hypothetical protein BDV97DRAFT_370117 [Delphinella strobiligena]
MDPHPQIFLAVFFPVAGCIAGLVVYLLFRHGFPGVFAHGTTENRSAGWTVAQHNQDPHIAGGRAADRAAERATEMTNHSSKQSSQTTLRAPQQGGEETDAESLAKLDAYHGFGHGGCDGECSGGGSFGFGAAVPDDIRLLERRK